MWFQSGRRRDLCALLYEAGELRGQKLKTRLETQYDVRIDPKSFYGTLDVLVSKGHLARRTEDIHDVYRLTERGEADVEAYYEWLTERVRANEPKRAGETEQTDEAERTGAAERSTR